MLESLETIVSFAKRRGFIFQSSEIYGGLSSCYDYGPLGVELKNNVKKAGIFGSYARGEQKKNSDSDILIEPPKGIGFGFAGIAIELENSLGKKVDLVTYKYISPYIKKQVLEEEIKIL